MARVDTIPYHYRIIKLNLEDGLDGLRIPFKGEVLIFHQGVTPLEIALNSAGNDKIPMFPKEKIEMTFNSIYIWADARPETAVLFLANPKGIQLSGGEVRVVTDTGYFNTMAQETWIGSQEAGNSLGNYSAVWLANDSDTHIGIVDALHIWCPNDRRFRVGMLNTTPGSSANVEMNKYAHAAAIGASNCYIDWRQNAARLGGQWTHGVTDNNEFQVIPKINHFIVPPGHTLYLEGRTTNRGIGATFEWREYSIAALYA